MGLFTRLLSQYIKHQPWVITVKHNLLITKKCSAFSTWVAKARSPTPPSETASVPSAKIPPTPKLTPPSETHPKKTWDSSSSPSRNTCPSSTKSRRTPSPLLLKTSLRVFDKESNGTVLGAELRHVLLSIGEKMEAKDVDALMVGQEQGEEGTVDYAKFSAYLLEG